MDKKARIWAKQVIERESRILGDGDSSSVLPADFIIPFENVYKDRSPPNIRIELRSLNLKPLENSIRTTRSSLEDGLTPLTDISTPPPAVRTCPATVTFTVSDNDTGEEHDYTYSLSKDINFVTAHPCVPSQHVKILKSPSSPTIQQVDLSGSTPGSAKSASIVGMVPSLISRLVFIFCVLTFRVLGHPLHKYYTYTALHLSELIMKQGFSLEALLGDYSSATAHHPGLGHAPPRGAAKVLVIDCITGFKSLPQEHEIPLSPVVSRTGSNLSGAATSPTPSHRRESSISITSPIGGEEGFFSAAFESASKKMHSETRRRQFGSDAEILVRAFCAEKGWNALISRRRRGCLSCAIREAGALGVRVIIRVD